MNKKPNLFRYHLQDDIENPSKQLTVISTSLESAVELLKRDALVLNGTMILDVKNIIVEVYR